MRLSKKEILAARISSRPKIALLREGSYLGILSSMLRIYYYSEQIIIFCNNKYCQNDLKQDSTSLFG